MSKTPQDSKPARPKKSARHSQNHMVTAVVATAFIATILSAGAVLVFQSLTRPETTAGAPAPRFEKFAYYDFPKLTVDLKRTGNRQAGLANIRVSAEFSDTEPLQVTRTALPRIVDGMQAYLRERTREELDGRQGTDMLRHAFLTIVNDAIVPHHANTVLFREIVIQ
jgi:flagellar basal body-associated protein FliL